MTRSRLQPCQPCKVLSEWLSILRAAPAGSVATLELGKSPVSHDLIDGLTPFLRYVRSCRAMVVAKVLPATSQLSWLDLIACLCADIVVAHEVQDDCAIEALDSGEIEDKVVKSMWQIIASQALFEECSYPKKVSDLRKAHLLSSEAELEIFRHKCCCMTPQFLLGYRRVGGLKLKSMNKSAYNYYFVTKVFLLEAALSISDSEFAPPARVEQSGSAPKAISAVFEEKHGILTLELHAELLDMPSADIASCLGSWVKDSRVTRIDAILPGASDAWLGRRIPGEAIRGNTSVFKWYRKWDNLLSQMAKLAPLHCEIRGPTVPALLELFFSAAHRIWSWEGANVGFQSAGFLPGPEFFTAQQHIGRAAMQRLLLQGFHPSEAVKLGIISSINGDRDAYSVTSHPIMDMGDTSPLLMLLKNRLGSYCNCANPRNDQLTVLANLVGMSLTLPGKQHEMSQMQVCERLGLKGTSLESLFEADHIQTRTLAQIGDHGFGFYSEQELTNGMDKYPAGQGILTQKHLRWARAMLADAVKAACEDAKQPLSAVRYISVCSSSGYLLPGLTSYLVHDLQLPRGTVRCDIVGMGCHAGLNSLQAAANWAALHPGQLAISCGVEVLSAHFMWNDSLKFNKDEAYRLNHALCNSLFSDGCFAVALVRPSNDLSPPCYATLHEFVSQTTTEALHTMTYQWNDVTSQFWFSLSEEAPYAVGNALHQLLHDQQDSGLPMEHVLHYVLHTGGQTVIDAAAAALGLDDIELLPTRSALRKFGNNSSVSFMFAFNELMEASSCPVVEGDLGVFITMGPGAGLELCLWSAGSRTACDSKIMERGMIQRIADPPWDAGLPGNNKIVSKCNPRNTA